VVKHSRIDTGCTISKEIFTLPIADAVLLYAPLHHLSALINHSALEAMVQDLRGEEISCNGLDDILSRLHSAPDPIPQSRTGDLNNPFFLGLLPTRGCNMACRYCDFLSGSIKEMSLDTVRFSVDAYLDLLQQNQTKLGAIHFFGGEPFHAPMPAQFAVEYARLKAEDMGIQIHFEATTNGNYDERLAGWIADNLDTVVLSLDGSERVQNLHRPLRNGAASFERVTASAHVFSDRDCELVIRTCVSNHNVDALPEIAAWFSQAFRPTTICFEPLSASETTERSALFPPEPLQFARRFSEAADILHWHGIRAVLSTADLSRNQATSCPVGKDALIITPDGAINACYLLEEEWTANDLNMRLGAVTADGFRIDPIALERARAFSVHQKTLCADCFCRFTCAGGCHVHHHTNRMAGQYDDQCIRTRLVSAALLLDGLGQSRMRAEWLANEALAIKTARQISDRIPFAEEIL
jgi:uncharacterized protein